MKLLIPPNSSLRSAAEPFRFHAGGDAVCRRHLMCIMVGVVVAIQIFALRIYTLAATKLVATQGAELR